MSGSNPKYLPIQKKVPYNIRLPKPLLDKLNAYAELTGNTTTDVVINGLTNIIKDKTLFNDYLTNINGISIKIPVYNFDKRNLIDEKCNCLNESYSDELGYKVETEIYDILRIPNNLDVFTKEYGYISADDKNKHSGIEFYIEPEFFIEIDNNVDDVFDLLYCFYFETYSNSLKKVMIIDYLDAVNKANDSGNINLKNRLISCIKELQELNFAFNDPTVYEKSGLSGEDYIYSELLLIADKYNTGNIILFGQNINKSIVDSGIKENQEYINSIIDEKIDLLINEKFDDVIADKVADIVDFRLRNIEKLVKNADNKDEY